MKLVGDLAYFAAILGVNGLFVVMLGLTKWRKSFLSLAWTAFFFIVALILDLSAAILFVPEWREFIRDYVRTPLYLLLAATVWALFAAALGSAIVGRAKNRKKVQVEVAPEKK